MSIPLDETVWPSGYFSKCIREMAGSVTELELWEWFRTEVPPNGYAWWDHDNIHKILNHLVDNKHSGPSFAIAMRNIHNMAINGFENWKIMYINNQATDKANNQVHSD